MQVLGWKGMFIFMCFDYLTRSHLGQGVVTAWNNFYLRKFQRRLFLIAYIKAIKFYNGWSPTIYKLMFNIFFTFTRIRTQLFSSNWEQFCSRKSRLIVKLWHTRPEGQTYQCGGMKGAGICWNQLAALSWERSAACCAADLWSCDSPCHQFYTADF